MLVRRHDLPSSVQPVASALAPADAVPLSEASNRRRIDRQSVLLSGRVEAGGASLDCIVLDVSRRGARLQFGVPVSLPAEVSLVLRDGSRHAARRCWSRGNQVGLEFLGAPRIAVNEAEHRRARGMVERVQATDPATWLPALRAERYFGDDAVREAAEALEVAHMRLLATLRPHAGAG